MVYGISKGYVYALRVLGFSKGGDGKMSPTQYFTLGKCNVARSQLYFAFYHYERHKLHYYVKCIAVFFLSQLHAW